MIHSCPLLRSLTLLLLMAGLTFSCQTRNSSDNTTEQTAALPPAPNFNADSAYAFVARQVAFGPRVPNSAAHVQTGNYLVETLKKYGFTVTEQPFTATTYDGKKLNARNIIGSYNPQASKRIMLASHWDSRPFADADSTQKNSPVPGANDGASGVGVLLEIARVLSQDSTKLSLGVDLVFFDAEDWGNSAVATDAYAGFCLGSQYWAANRHIPNYTAYFGVLLDMVGAKGATFPKEGYSTKNANEVVRNVWTTASQLGYSTYFIDQQGPSITDDHVPVNEIAKFPMIDIIHMQVNNLSQTFFKEWHTTEDDMDTIDPATLKAVGQTLIQVLYNEAQPVI
ncbi:M28 family peptidase [Arundinibacter roseus]|uniref:M28 family peptidase n=1 Tax=Arundinibacter roseus TaxID=2070510 RepID=A0A4R4KR84_9BACT|nr:M28 family peptidase [Arundinibacter roseus]TDB68921.1 M28 family peptidase [Arundinibacter roseus]